MNDDGPRRLIDEAPGAGLDGLLEGLRAAREDVPDEDQLAALAARLPLGPGGGGGGGEGAPLEPAIEGASASGALAQGALKLIAAASLVIGGGLLWRAAEAPPTAVNVASPDVGAPLDAAPTSPAASAPAPDARVEPDAAPDAQVERPHRPKKRRPKRRRVRAPKPAPAKPPTLAKPPEPAPDPAEEVALLQRAQRALAADPAEALRLAETHRARFHQPLLVQEREVIAIEALARLGRATAARARGQRFKARWPRSSHIPRLTRLVEGAP